MPRGEVGVGPQRVLILSLWWASCSPGDAAAPGCEYGLWDEPKALTAENVILRFPRIGGTERLAIVVGNGVVELGESPLPDTIFRGFAISKTEVVPFSIDRPRAMHPFPVPGREQQWILWGGGDPPPVSGREWLLVRYGEIWGTELASDLTPGRTLRLHAGPPTIHLGRNAASVAGAGGAGRALFVDDRLAPSLLTHLDLHDGEASDGLEVGFGAFPSAAIGPSGHLFAAYAGYDFATGRSGVVYLAERNPQSGWDEPRLVPGSEGGGARDTFLAVDARGVTIFWLDDRGVVFARSHGFGEGWDSQVLLEAPNLDSLRGAVDRCGNVHLVFLDWGSGIRVRYLLVGPSGTGVQESQPFPDMEAFEPGLAVIGDVVFVVASGRDVDGTTHVPLFTQRSVVLR